MSGYNVSGDCGNYFRVVCQTGVMAMSGVAIGGSFGYTGSVALEPEPNETTHDWVNDPNKGGGPYIYQLGHEDPIYEVINGKTVVYQRRWVPKRKFPQQNLGPRENVRPAPSPKGIRKEVRIAGFGENQKLKL